MFSQPPDDFSLPSLLSSQWRFHRNTLVTWITFFASSRDEMKRGNGEWLTTTRYWATNVNFACFSLYQSKTGDEEKEERVLVLMYFYEFHVVFLLLPTIVRIENLTKKTEAMHIGCLLMTTEISTATEAVRRSNQKYREIIGRDRLLFIILLSEKNSRLRSDRFRMMNK